MHRAAIMLCLPIAVDVYTCNGVSLGRSCSLSRARLCCSDFLTCLTRAYFFSAVPVIPFMKWSL